jgi:hypothetical protein
MPCTLLAVCQAMHVMCQLSAAIQLTCALLVRRPIGHAEVVLCNDVIGSPVQRVHIGCCCQARPATPCTTRVLSTMLSHGGGGPSRHLSEALCCIVLTILSSATLNTRDATVWCWVLQVLLRHHGRYNGCRFVVPFETGRSVSMYQPHSIVLPRST